MHNVSRHLWDHHPEQDKRHFQPSMRVPCGHGRVMDVEDKHVLHHDQDNAHMTLTFQWLG